MNMETYRNKNSDENAIVIEQVFDKDMIFALLQQFDSVFPHLKEKIDDYKEYAVKISKYAVVCVAKECGKICGFMVFYANDTANKMSYMSLIGLLENWQGRNLGNKLMNYWYDYVNQKGMRTLRLEVDLDNHRAIDFYKKNGFVQVGKNMDSSIYMEKVLL